MRRMMAVAFTALAVLMGQMVMARAMDIREITSPAGIKAWLLVDRSVPLVALRFAFRGGSALDPDGKAGLSEITANLLNDGAGDFDALRFQGWLEDRSVQLGFDVDADMFGGRLKTLKDHAGPAFDMLGLALTQPRFDAADIERTRAQMISQIIRQSQRPGTVASLRWNAAVYPDHPYGRPASGTEAGLKMVTRDDMLGVVKARFGRDQLKIAIVGDLDETEAGALLDRAFASLPARAAAFAVPEAKPGKGGLIVVPMDVPQSNVMFGQGGIKRDDPDFYAAYVLMHVLGGSGFSSRLMQEVREIRGLAYSVSSYLVPRQHGGLIIGGAGTENDRVAQTIEIIRAEWVHARDQGLTDAELADAKANINGGYALRFTSTDRIAEQLLAIQLDNLGLDYITRRSGIINAVTADDVRRVAKRLLDPDSLTIVVVGRPKGLGG